MQGLLKVSPGKSRSSDRNIFSSGPRAGTAASRCTSERTDEIGSGLVLQYGSGRAYKESVAFLRFLSASLVVMMSLGGLVSCLMMLPAMTFAQHRTVDFRWSPPQYMSAICLPDDWQKTLVTERGALAYDFGPGPYARPLTEISIGIQGKDLEVVSQRLQDPVVPIVSTELKADGAFVKQLAFAVVPEHPGRSPSNLVRNNVRRLNGLVGCENWAAPAGRTD